MARNASFHYLRSCTSPESNHVNLLVRQQPIHARISTNSERDRRPIDPPPIIQIKLEHPADESTTSNFLQDPHYFMCANLVHPFDDEQVYTPSYSALSGQTVSSMYKLKDVDDKDGAFFVFGELSIKVQGSFRLKFSLFEVTTTGAVCHNSIFSEPFVAYTAKQFPCVLEPTFLSRSFSDQGARIRIRKDNRHHTTMSRKRKLGAVPLTPEEVSRQKHRFPLLPSPSVKNCSPARTSSEPLTISPPNATWPLHMPLRAAKRAQGHPRTESVALRSSSIENNPSQYSPTPKYPTSPPQQPYDKYRVIVYPLSPTRPHRDLALMPSPPLHPKKTRLPPLRSLFQSDAVDAAVTMMQLRRPNNSWYL